MFYTNVVKKGNKIHILGYENNKKIHKTVDFKPSLYFKDPSGKHLSIYDDKLKKKQFNSISEFSSFKYSNKGLFDLFGDIDPIYQCLYDIFPDKIEYDLKQIRTWFLDIETPHPLGFPSPDLTPAEIKSICIYDTFRKEYLTLGLKKCKVKRGKFKCYRNEVELLKGFMKLNTALMPDIWIAHNGIGFDFPYIVNRISLLGLNEKELSPIKSVRCNESEKPNKWGIMKKSYKTTIGGISLIDNIELYKKYVFKPRASYKLNELAEVDLEQKKVDYSEYDNLCELFENDYQKAIDYNIQDVSIMVDLNLKYNYLMAHIINTFRSKSKSFEESMKPTKLWDSYLNYSMIGEGKQTIQQKEIEKFSYPGAYVMQPITRKRKNCISFDLDSLYPHLQMEWEISPENLVKGLTVDKWLNSLSSEKIMEMISKETNEKKKKFLVELEQNINFGIKVEPINQKELDPRMLNGLIPKHPQYIMTANGFYFRKNEGIMPRLLKKDYAERKEVKKEMNRLKVVQENEGKTHERADKILSLHALEIAIKTMMNSGYGAFGSVYFRYCMYELCSSITMNGQLAIKWLNRYLKETFGDSVEIVYNDTDSVVGDTKIYYDDEQLTIEKLYNKLVKENQGQFVVNDDFNENYVYELTKNHTSKSYSIENGIENDKIKYIMKHKVKKKMYKIIIKEKEVIVTQDHSIMILRDEKLISVKPDQIIKGDKLLYII